jgi:hypothetical protein
MRLFFITPVSQTGETIYLVKVLFADAAPAAGNAGNGNWSGNWAGSVIPPNVAASGTFALSLGFLDGTSFLAKFSKFTIVVGKSSCTLVMNANLVKTGNGP